MTKLLTAVSLLVLTVTGFAQGFVNFSNSSSTLVINDYPSGPISGPIGAYYFALLTAPFGTTDPADFTFSGAYGTNLATPGRFSGGVQAIPGWLPGTARAFMVAGWSADLGHDWKPAWLLSYHLGVGISQISQGIAGGFDGEVMLPVLNIFGSQSINSGFSLNYCLGPYFYPSDFLIYPSGPLTVNSGTNFAFYASVRACPPPMFYQWYCNGVAIPGANTNPYQITNVQPLHAGYYDVVVSSPYWGVHHSPSANLTVLTQPIITTQPQSQSAVVGSAVELEAQAAGPPPLSYHWLFNDNALLSATTAELVLTNLQLSNSGSYILVVTNVYGAVTSAPAVLTVRASPPTFALSPWSRTVVVGTFLDLVADAVGALPLSYQWYFNSVPIAGATTPDLHFDSIQFSNAGNYSVVVTNAFGSAASAPALLTVVPRPIPRKGTIVSWGSNSEGQSAVPNGLSNIVAIAAGGSQSLAIDASGRVYAWGYNSVGQSTVPSGLTNVIAVSAGGYHTLALKADGTVVAWGFDRYAQSTVPAGLHEVIAISAGGQHSLALRSDGTVMAWGFQGYGPVGSGPTNVPPDLRGVVAISAGARHNLALRFDGTVVTWGASPSTMPSGLGGVIAIAAGGDNSLALKSDGTVVAWGNNYYGQSTVPLGLRNVTAIAAGWDYFNFPDSHSLALTSDGTVTAWGYAVQGLNGVPAGLGDVSSVAAGSLHNLALVSQEPAIDTGPTSQTAEIGATVKFWAKAVGHPPLNYLWLLAGDQVIAGATNPVLQLPGIQPEHSGTYQLVVTNTAGAVTSAPAMLNVIPAVERRTVPGIVLSAQPGSLLNMEWSSAIGVSPEWTAFPKVYSTNGPQFFFDLSSPLPSQRFYRASQTNGPGTILTLALQMIPALTLAGNPGELVRVDGINAIGPADAWFPLDTVTLTNSSQLFFDVSAPGQPTRLYRLTPLP